MLQLLLRRQALVLCNCRWMHHGWRQLSEAQRCGFCCTASHVSSNLGPHWNSAVTNAAQRGMSGPTGRGSAKKWKQSIRLREGNSTLGKWLLEQHLIQGPRLGTAVIGRTVWVLWPANVSVYTCVIYSRRPQVIAISWHAEVVTPHESSCAVQDMTYFKGRITTYNPATGSHHVKYHDGANTSPYHPLLLLQSCACHLCTEAMKPACSAKA